jgi:ATP-binding cassette subfamily B protein
MPVRPTHWTVLRELFGDADRQVKLRVAVAVLAICAGALLAALAPLALKGTVDALNPQVNTSGVTSDALAFALAYVAALSAARLLSEVRPFLVGAAQQRLQARFSRRFFAHLIGLPASFHLDQQTGALPQKLNHASAATQLATSSVLQTIPAVIELAAVAFVLSQLHQPVLLGIFLASAAAYALIFSRGVTAVRRSSQQVSAHAISAQATLADALLGVETIKSFNAGHEANRRYCNATEALERSWSSLHRHRAQLGLACAAVFGMSVAASVIVAVAEVQRGTLSVGGLVLTTVYMLQMVRPIEVLGIALRDLGQAVEFALPALEILRLPSEVNADAARAPGRWTAGRGPVDVHLCGLRLSYPPGPNVLDGLSLRIPAGTSVAIVGPSGSGKSSLARLIVGLAQPDAGGTFFGSESDAMLDPTEMRAMTGFVPQDIVLFDDTIAMNVAFGRPEALPHEIEEACRGAYVHDFIQSLPAGYATRVGPRGLKLSGGERQRIGIARAILKAPCIYLLDEPTSALDAHTESILLEELGRVCAGCTTIIITHRLAAARCAQQIAVLEQGRIVELGTHAALLNQGGAYARMWRLQNGDVSTAATQAQA